MIAWSHSRPIASAVGLFDKDSSAQKTRAACLAKLKTAANHMVFGVSLKPAESLKMCYKQGICVPFAIEELLPRRIWDICDKKGWLEDRHHPMALYGFNERDVTFDDYMKERLPPGHLRRIALKKVRLSSKKKLCEYVRGLPEDERRQVLKGFKPTVTECLKKLKLLDEIE